MPKDRRRPHRARQRRPAAVRPGDRRRVRAAAARAGIPAPAPAGPFRRVVERRSARTLVTLHAQPRWVPFLLVAGLLLTGLAVAGPVGTVALLLLDALLAWLLFLSWPSLDRRARAARAAVLGAVVGLALGRLLF